MYSLTLVGREEEKIATIKKDNNVLIRLRNVDEQAQKELKELVFLANKGALETK